jgi:threonine dehydratase
MKYFSPGTIVMAGEPEGADDAYRSMQSGKREKSQGKSIADGLLTSIGEKTFEIIKDKTSKVITVSDEEIINAMGLIWEKLKIVIEPSAAVPFAAILKDKETFDGKKVGVILSGGNVDLEKVAKWFQ